MKLNLKEHFQNIIKDDKSPKAIAMGFAIGCFFGILPTFGLEIPIMFFILIIFKRISKVSMIGAYVLFNPLVVSPLYILSYIIGDYLFKDIPVTFVSGSFLGKAWDYTRRFLVGSFVVGIVISAIAYAIIFYLANRYQNKEIKKIVKKYSKT